MPTLPQSPLLLPFTAAASVCAAVASSSDSGEPGGATSVCRSCCSDLGYNGWKGDIRVRGEEGLDPLTAPDL